ncbi:MAG TPA: hypothetical protein PKM41_13475 [Deltaproteobacteria bacterium]|nr:hypothetical protein [Deltaproteobacteria bacterium]HOI07557.1 hypothetical protein [Deltaproteobacteria bacterium]
MNGEQLAWEALAIHPDMPVILMTGYSENMSREQALEIGVRAFIEEPFTRKSIRDVIRECLEDRRERT